MPATCEKNHNPAGLIFAPLDILHKKYPQNGGAGFFTIKC